MSTPHRGRPAPGLSEQLRALERAQDAGSLPDFDLDAAVRGGRRRARRRAAASLVATAAAVAAVATTVALSPSGADHAGPPPAQHPTTGSTDTGYITDITGSRSTPRITVDRVTCDEAADRAAQAQSDDQELCVVPNPDPSSEAGPYLPGEDTHTSYQVALDPAATVIGSVRMQSVLAVPGGPDGTWFQQPMSQRRLGVADLRTFLDSPEGHDTRFRLHVDGRGRVDRVVEVYAGG